MKIKGMKVSTSSGHTKDGTKDSGASGIGNEYKMNVEVKNIVISKLTALGAIVKDCSLENCNSLIESLSHRSNTSNEFGAKVHIEIHHNAFNNQAHGTEVEYLSVEGAKLAQCIQNEFVKLGFTDRKIQKRDNLYILKHTNAIVCLTEGCFVDSANDMKIYNAEKEADAIVKGLLTYIGDPIQPSPQNKIEFKKILHIGDKNDFVKQVQQLFNQVLNPAKEYRIIENGYYTKEFAFNVVKKFQTENNVKTPDGVFDKETFDLLVKKLK